MADAIHLYSVRDLALEITLQKSGDRFPAQFLTHFQKSDRPHKSDLKPRRRRRFLTGHGTRRLSVRAHSAGSSSTHHSSRPSDGPGGACSEVRRGTSVMSVTSVSPVSVPQKPTDRLHRFPAHFQKSDRPTPRPRFLSLDPLLYVWVAVMSAAKNENSE